MNDRRRTLFRSKALSRRRRTRSCGRPNRKLPLFRKRQNLSNLLNLRQRRRSSSPSECFRLNPRRSYKVWFRADGLVSLSDVIDRFGEPEGKVISTTVGG